MNCLSSISGKSVKKVMTTEEQSYWTQHMISKAPGVVRQCCRSVVAALEGRCGLWVCPCCIVWWDEVGEGWGTQRCRPEAPEPSVSEGAAGSH